MQDLIAQGCCYSFKILKLHHILLFPEKLKNHVFTLHVWKFPEFCFPLLTFSDYDSSFFAGKCYFDK